MSTEVHKTAPEKQYLHLQFDLNCHQKRQRKSDTTNSMSHVFIQTALLAALLYTAPRTGSAAKGYPLKQTTAAKLCVYSKTAKGQPARLKAALKNVQTTAAAAAKLSLQHKLLGLLHPAATKAATIMQMTADEIHRDAMHKINTLAAEATTLVSQAAYSAGRVDELISLMGQLKDSTTAYCIGADGANSAPTSAAYPGCEIAKIDDVPAAPNGVAAALNDAFGGTETITSNQNTKCKLTGDPNTELEVVAATNIDLLGGALQVDQSGNFGNSKKFMAGAADKPILHNMKANNAAVEAALGSTAIDYTTDTALKAFLTAQKPSAFLKTAVIAYYNWPSNKPETDVDEAIKQIFGITPETKESVYAELAKTTTTDILTTGAKQSKPILAINEQQLDQAIGATVEVMLQAPKPTIECSEKEAAAKQDEEECNAAGDDQKKCDKLKNKGCVFNLKGDEGKKCTLSENAKQAVEKAKENEGKIPTVDCSKLDTKPKCEEANKPGKPATCGWRKGKDGEDDQDKEKCRNGSFLVNKTFEVTAAALIVF
ncbi:Trypanosome variant surface glycoprotein (A-type)/Trypanosome variant surface glycoprotein C-terminal domain containing protein, putative [Trypanosoma equiperdum]|uniref:Trypanosome variant surface glycoprotein (A-type)/Trypanosome variant surface glycoprotein C-terminal domain containing protein, putative n=1 Tax=Trypanosoma equiperdum TaxID=5694 RepID=A0A1G4IKQ8_TRYEQ|nr:Trypanosome variant surface glycoprotein (A-type)/Trypanosome variant surface glycoprotein C-terminal domain containing protein, putative [Trypanosoma equiperdum]